MDYNIGFEIRYFCEKCDFSKEYLANKLQCPLDLIESWFSGVSPEPKYLLRISEKLPISLCQIFRIEDSWFENKLRYICSRLDYRDFFRVIATTYHSSCEIPSVYVYKAETPFDAIVGLIQKSLNEIALDLSASLELVESWSNGYVMTPKWLLLCVEKYNIRLSDVLLENVMPEDTEKESEILKTKLQNYELHVLSIDGIIIPAGSYNKFCIQDGGYKKKRMYSDYDDFLHYTYQFYDDYKKNKENIYNVELTIPELWELEYINYLAWNTPTMKNNRKSLYEEYYDWLGNHANDRNDIYYKAVMLMCSYVFFENDEYLSMNDFSTKSDNNEYMFSDVYKNLDFIYDRTIEILENSQLSDFTVLGLDNDAMCMLQHIFGAVYSGLFISDSGCFRNYKELITRKYILFYMGQNNTESDEKITKALKNLTIYKLSEGKLMEKAVYDETNLICYENLWQVSPLELSEYSVYDSFLQIRITKYKDDFDVFCFELLSWMYQKNLSDFDSLEYSLETYLKNNKSRYKDYNSVLSELNFKKRIKESLSLDNADKTYYEILADFIKSDSIDESTKSDVEEEIVREYNLPIEELKAMDTSWYEYVVTGQYYYSSVAKNFRFSDYSVPVSLWCKCVEDMTYKKIYKPLQLTKNTTISYRLRQDQSKDEFTLGKIRFIFYRKNGEGYVPIWEVVNAAKNELHYPDDFFELVDAIRKLIQYRNETAHRFEISQIKADECKKLLFLESKIIIHLMNM